MFCDWNWPTVGAAWLDTLFMLIGPRGDGLDVDAVLAARPLTREVDADHVDRVLALLVGYFFKSADEPVPPTSPLPARPPALAGRGRVAVALRAARLVSPAMIRAVGVRAPWTAMPDHVRAWAADELGSPVVEAHDQVGGMSPGLRHPAGGRRRQPGVRQGRRAWS